MTAGMNGNDLAADLLADLVVADAVEADVVAADVVAAETRAAGQGRPKPAPRRAVRVAPVHEPPAVTGSTGVGVSGYLRLARRDWRLPSVSTRARGLALQVGPLRAGLSLEP